MPVSSFLRETPYLDAEVMTFDLEEETFGGPLAEEAMLRALTGYFEDYAKEAGNLSEEVTSQILQNREIGKMVDQIAVNLPLPWEKRQALLEAVTVSERFETLSVILTGEAEVQRIRRELQEKVKERLDKNQKEYILREQLKAIREELGDDTTLSDVDRFREACGALQASDEVKDRIQREIGRFASLNAQSPEGAVLRGYIETLLAMPWDKAGQDCEDLSRAKEILERDHYGLEKIKERVLEYLAVLQLTKKGTSPILCLVGPPGTGKTSIGHSIAEALDKKYLRLALGGVHDEAEIRGHRRTYVGALPGRIAACLKSAGVKNPLIVLDEVDKVGADHRGDPASALLEVLDSEQNSHFEDHYIEIPIDLSEVLFIATANNAQTIPRPLLDRMEIIEVTSYTENEKLHIAKEHLIPKQKRQNGIGEEQLSISDGALSDLITRYTREAGVRQLERKIGEICRKTARRILEEGKPKVSVTEKNLASFLGNPRYTVNPANGEDEIGIVRGLAWTAVGGETLQVEVNVMPGKGEFVRGRDEGIGTGRHQLYPLGSGAVRSRRGLFSGTRHPHPYSGGSGAQGRPLRGNYHGDGDDLRGDPHSGARRRGDDRRDHPPGARPADRRPEGKTAGGKKGGHPHGARAGEEPAGCAGDLEGDHPESSYRLCLPDGGGAQRSAPHSGGRRSPGRVRTIQT